VTNRVVCSHVMVKEFIVGREAPVGRVGDWLMTGLYWGGAVRLGLHRSHPANRSKKDPPVSRAGWLLCPISIGVTD
jgi:hypothetical protein